MLQITVASTANADCYCPLQLPLVAIPSAVLAYHLLLLPSAILEYHLLLRALRSVGSSACILIFDGLSLAQLEHTEEKDGCDWNKKYNQ